MIPIERGREHLVEGMVPEPHAVGRGTPGKIEGRGASAEERTRLKVWQ